MDPRRCAPLVAFFNGMCARILHGPRVSVLKVTARFSESRYSFGRPRFSTPSFLHKRFTIRETDEMFVLLSAA